MGPDSAEKEALGLAVLAAGSVEGPPAGPWRRERAYPLALDIDDRDGLAAVSFAILDMYPDIAPGWWCEVVTFAWHEGGWRYAAGESDNTTAADPFARPETPSNSVVAWCDWHTNGPVGGWGEADAPDWRHHFFGIALAGTQRLSVTDRTGRERDLSITPWNGAYVAIVRGVHSVLTGYDTAGKRLGAIKPMDGLDQAT